MVGECFVVTILVAASIPAVLFTWNLFLFRRLPVDPPIVRRREGASILLPVRDEEEVIEDTVQAVLASTAVELEVIVLDDSSGDRTVEIVEGLRATDPRVRVERAGPLPAGWCGKQHACHLLSRLARYPVLIFLDADVRVAPDGVARILVRLSRGEEELLSGFPQQRTGTFLEKLLLPLIHFLLLGFLPIFAMRRSRHPAFGAACGQLIACRKEDYVAAGGHEAIRASLHDGLALPRLFRHAGRTSDIFDAGDVASCRMYRSGAEVIAGLSKNATEGMAQPKPIVFWTLLLGLGQVAPLPALAVAAAWSASAGTIGLLVVATTLSFLPRVLAAVRFRQTILGAMLHPLGVFLLLGLQWRALVCRARGRAPQWKGREYPEAP